MIISVITFVVLLSILILVHEFGHFIVARKKGIWVEEFGIGYPPKIWAKKIGETIYSINLLPLGGFVRLHGEQTEDGVTKPDRAFISKSKKTRFFVLVAGVAMNFLLAIVCFAIYYSFMGIPKFTETGKVLIANVFENSPAEKSGLKAGDIILTIDGYQIATSEEFIKYIDTRRGKEVGIKVDRQTETKQMVLVPRVKLTPEGNIFQRLIITMKNYVSEEGPIGVAISSTDGNIEYPNILIRPFIGIYHGIKQAFVWGGMILEGLLKMLIKITFGIVPKDIAGPVGMFALTTEVAKLGILELINFMGIISVNLAIINFLPIPALDGGRFLFILIEKIIGRKVIPKVEAAIHGAGMAILLLLMLVITFVEVKRLIIAGSLQGFLESTLK